MPLERCDVAVIGAGFGGLAAALDLAESGARVVLLERLSYPGGCAATYTRKGHRFEAGATLFSGLDTEGLFGRWIARHRLPVTIDWIDPLVEFRTPDVTIRAWRDRARLEAELRALPGAPARPISRFLRFQRRVSDRLWSILGDPSLLPPWRPAAILPLARRALGLAGLAPWIGRPLEDLLRYHRLAEFEPLRQYLDSLCQITVQAGVTEAETAFALAAIDYHHRGTGHVRGGIGELARALATRTAELGGDVRFSSAARSLRRENGTWRIETRRGTLDAPHVIANLVPAAVRRLLDDPRRDSDGLDDIDEGARDGWGACMLYRTIEAGPDDAPHHLQLRARGPGEAIEGHHVLCSVQGASDGERAPGGERTMSVSTHVPLATLRALDDAGRGAYVAEVQERMRRTIDALAPEWRGRVRTEWTASPRTFERFTGRPEGWVGGVPRRAGLEHYLRLGARRPRPGLLLIGDSGFPGQSTLAVALGGVRAAERVRRAGS